MENHELERQLQPSTTSPKSYALSFLLSIIIYIYIYMCVCGCVCFSFEVICYIVFYLILTISSSFDTIAAWVRDSTMWSDSLCVVVSLSADLRLCADVEL